MIQLTGELKEIAVQFTGSPPHCVEHLLPAIVFDVGTGISTDTKVPVQARTCVVDVTLVASAPIQADSQTRSIKPERGLAHRIISIAHAASPPSRRGPQAREPRPLMRYFQRANQTPPPPNKSPNNRQMRL